MKMHFIDISSWFHVLSMAQFGLFHASSLEFEINLFYSIVSLFILATQRNKETFSFSVCVFDRL